MEAIEQPTHGDEEEDTDAAVPMPRAHSRPSSRRGTPSSLPLLASLVGLLISGCGGSQLGESTASPVEESLVSEPSGDGAEGAEIASEETEAPAEAEPSAVVPGCVASLSVPSTERQLRTFRRWLRDQSVGRHLSIENLQANCGDREGFLVIELVLSGPAGGLQSLSRALTSYYPGSSWNVVDYERMEGRELSLRVNVEVSVPAGAEPRPRCTWDPSMSCGDEI